MRIDNLDQLKERRAWRKQITAAILAGQAVDYPTETGGFHRKQYGDLTVEARQREIRQIEDSQAAAEKTFYQQRQADLRKRFESARDARKEIILKNELETERNMPAVTYQRAGSTVESRIALSGSVRDFMTWYEQSASLPERLAAQDRGAVLLRKRYPHDPGNGSASDRLERDKANKADFEDENSLAFGPKLQAIYDEVSELATADQRAWHEENAGNSLNAIETGPRGRAYNDFVNLRTEVYAEMEKIAGRLPGGDRGRTGGDMYMPQSIEKIAFQ